MAEDARWSLVNVESALDRWIEIDGPDDDLRNTVLNWLLSRRPPARVRLPRRRAAREFICDSIATLRLPI